MLVQILTEGFSLGASTGVLCLGTCAPFLVPYLMMGARPNLKENAPLVIQFFLGRFLAYFLFGMCAGWIGGEIRPHLSANLRSATLIATSAFMIFFALTQKFPKRFCFFAGGAKPLKLRAPFLLGLLLGLNICPPFLVGMARLLEIGNLWFGALFFTAFFVSSSFYLLPLFAVSPFISSDRLKNVGFLASLLVGGWFLLTGVFALLSA
ncbi:MAG: hypothetical protein A3C47_02280 [Omnitrophica bacterium RIFCSPHIGHO2_02_FULL_51_18]|nr:MAG: hypothetical protein A3C47_02280 [Omnitrophica bacterium RIFCSPHIGHO2_02_FULL_51_18]